MKRPEAALFALALVAYAYFYQAGGWNQNSRFDLVRAVVERGTSSIEGLHHNTGDHAVRDGVHYCDKAPGASWLGAPVYGLVHLVAGSAAPSERYLAASAYVVTVVAVGVPSALAVVALFVLLVAMGLRRGASAALAAAYGFATLAFPYATLFYGHQLMASLVLIGFAVLVRARHRLLDGGAAPGPVPLVGAGLALGYAVVVEYPAALAVVPITGYACAFLWRVDRRAIGWLVLGGAIPGLALAGYHGLVFGGPLTLPYEFSTQHHRSQGFMGIGTPRDGAAWGVLFSSYRGLFFSAPWLLLAVPGAVALGLERRTRPEAIVAAVVALLFVWLNISLVDWQGGWTMGARYLVPAVPFMVIATAGGVLAWRAEWSGYKPVAAWIAFGAVAGYSAFMMFAATAVKPEVDVRIHEPYARFLLQHFYRGELSVSTQGIHMKAAPRGGPRQAWNLGHLMGLDGFASLIPLLLLATVGVAWLLLAVRRARDG